jgi:hypothetical protein
MELFFDNVSLGNDWTSILRETIDKIVSCKKIQIDEIKPNYKSLHAGLYKSHPLIIKNGPHGYYLDYNKKCISLNAFIDMGNDVSIWIEEGIDGMTDERKKLLTTYMNQSSIYLSDDISIRKGKDEKYYLFYKTKKMKKPKFYSFPNEYMDDIDNLKDYIQKKYKLIC